MVASVAEITEGYDMINRRDVMLGGLAGAAALGFGRVNPDFLMNSAFAAEGKTLRFLGAEALTGNWDPTTHTNLGQIIAEGFVFGYLTRAPMKRLPARSSGAVVSGPCHGRRGR
jgi:hypothetical protein